MMDLFGPDSMKLIVSYYPDPRVGGKFDVSIYNRETGDCGDGNADDLDTAIAQAKAQIAEEMAS